MEKCAVKCGEVCGECGCGEEWGECGCGEEWGECVGVEGVWGCVVM